jgi:phospholipid-binding lipoprotein MlaA
LKVKRFLKVVILLLLFLQAACAHTGALSSTGDTKKTRDDTPVESEVKPDEVFEEKSVADPFEPWNRIVFTFNDRLYYWVMKPAAKGYNAVVPQGARVSVRNFFNNLSMPVRFVNASLQLKIESAAIELARFAVNTTLGLAGFFDVAKKSFCLESQEEDLGMTLSFYGIGEGIYFVWPFLGPLSLRDTVGTIGDGFLSPVNYISPAEDAFAINSYEYFNNTTLHIGEYEDLKESAIDPYTAVKDAYIQQRRYLIGK